MKVISYETDQDYIEIGGEESSMGYYLKSEKNKAAKDLRKKVRPERKNIWRGPRLGRQSKKIQGGGNGLTRPNTFPQSSKKP